jgi:protein ImuB
MRRVRLGFVEPIADPADLARAAERLAADLVLRLARQETGARRLDLAFHRIDGRVEHIVLGTARPSRDPHHIAALFKARLDTVDPGPGVEDMILAAFAVEPLKPEQLGLAGAGGGADASGLAPLLDRLGNRLGLAALSRIEARESHIPERASVPVPIDGFRPARKNAEEPKPPRPIRLFEPPEPVEASWLLPDDPPFRFTWRRRAYRVGRADGPERIAAEWWRPAASGTGESGNALRDYYRVEDEVGRRFWLFRAGLADGGRPPRWYVHGVFA